MGSLPVAALVSSHADARLQPVQVAYAAMPDTPAPTVQATAAPTPTVPSEDGSTAATKLARDDKLRRTLLALRRQAAGLKPVTGAGLSSKQTRASSIVVGGSVNDIPAVALTAYRRAALQQDTVDPSCHVTWSLLAGIGRVESSHGQYGGSQPDASGEVHPAILGPVLEGSGGNAAIGDTDGGKYDGNTQWDRAVGPMQFIPSSWQTGGRDGNGDGIRDPENLFDAALAAANYLCRSGGDLRTTSAAEKAVLTYNHSWDYVLVVLGYSASYANQDLSTVTSSVARHLIQVPRRTTGLRTEKRTTTVTKRAVVPRVTPTKRAPVQPALPVAPVAPPQTTPNPAPSNSPAPPVTVPPTVVTTSPSASPTLTPSPSSTPAPSVPPGEPTIVTGS